MCRKIPHNNSASCECSCMYITMQHIPFCTFTLKIQVSSWHYYISVLTRMYLGRYYTRDKVVCKFAYDIYISQKNISIFVVSILFRYVSVQILVSQSYQMQIL